MVAAVLFASLSPLRGLRRFYMTFLNEEREREREERHPRQRSCERLFVRHTLFYIKFNKIRVGDFRMRRKE